MSKPMSEQMQQVATRYEKATGKKFDQMTNADHIRSMTDEELAKHLYRSFDDKYCSNAPECAELLETNEGIPDEMCQACLLKWLKQPYKEET